METQSVNGNKYFLSVVDEHSRFVFVEPLRTKGQASQSLLRFTKRFEKQSDPTAQSLYTDGGSAFHRARTTVEPDGVEVTVTTPYTPQSNGLPERYNVIMFSLARTCLKRAKLPIRYLDLAIRHVADCKIFVAHLVTKKASIDTVFGRVPSDIYHLEPFGGRMLFQPVAKGLSTLAQGFVEGVRLFHEGAGVDRVQYDSGMHRRNNVWAFEKYFPGTRHLGVTGSDSDSDNDTMSDREGYIS